MSKNILLPLLLFLMVISSTINARPKLYGFSPAVLKSTDKMSEIIAGIKIKKYVNTELEFEINQKGELLDISVIDSSFQMVADDLLNFIDEYEFEPALYNDKLIQSKLIVRIEFSPYLNRLIFPYSYDDTTEVNSDLFYKSCEKSGFQFSRILNFPSYYCNLTFVDTSLVYPIIILKVSLDEMGKITDISSDFSTFPGFDDQLISAAMYAEYTPTIFNNQPIACEVYVVISFYNMINYPTPIWYENMYDSMSIIEQNRVKIFPSKLGLISKPLPQKEPGNEINYNSVKVFLTKATDFYMSINSEAIIRTSMLSKRALTSQNRDIIVKYLSKMRFYPAVNFEGQAVNFKGIIQLTRFNESLIRINYNW